MCPGGAWLLAASYFGRHCFSVFCCSGPHYSHTIIPTLTLAATLLALPNCPSNRGHYSQPISDTTRPPLPRPLCHSDVDPSCKASAKPLGFPAAPSASLALHHSDPLTGPLTPSSSTLKGPAELADTAMLPWLQPPNKPRRDLPLHASSPTHTTFLCLCFPIINYAALLFASSRFVIGTLLAKLLTLTHLYSIIHMQWCHACFDVLKASHFPGHKATDVQPAGPCHCSVRAGEGSLNTVRKELVDDSTCTDALICESQLR